MEAKLDNILKTEENGIEYYTVAATGESGMSDRGLARACGKRLQTIQGAIADMNKYSPPLWLDRFKGKELVLIKEKDLTVYKADFCLAAIAHYAFKGSEKAQDFYFLIADIELTRFIQCKTGWTQSAKI